MKATFVKTKKGTWACIQKTVRINGVPTSQTVRRLGLLDDIKKEQGCEDAVAWVKKLAADLTAKEKEGKETVTIELPTYEKTGMGERPLLHGGDLLMWGIYNRLGLPDICRKIARKTRVKYDLDEILRTLVFSRILLPCSKAKTFEFAKDMIVPPVFSENDMYRSLSLLSGHINMIQAHMYRNSKKLLDRKERVLYFDCSNYYFETEENDVDRIDKETGEFMEALRKRGKSKEHRPSPIVQMGLFMDGDGIPLAFVIFPGNESEQVWLQPLEETLGREFELVEFVVSTDSGLASEGNRRYNMAEGRDYICVQSLPSLKAADQEMALAPEGWRIAYSGKDSRESELPSADNNHQIFNLNELLNEAAGHPGVLKDITFYKEIVVEKSLRYDNPEWLEKEKKDRGAKHVDTEGKPIPRQLCTPPRNERIIVTYDHDYALFLAQKRDERLKQAAAIVKNCDEKGRQSQQSPRKYIKTVHRTKKGEVASKVEMAIDEEAVSRDARFDGFYAYGTSLDDDAVDILRARSFHHEIEHLFRTTKTILGTRPVFLARPDRIKSHFLTCFIALYILKLIQKQVADANAETYSDNPLSIDSLVETLRTFRFFKQGNHGYSPAYMRTILTDQLQEYAGVQVNNKIITNKQMKQMYRNVK